VLITNFEPDCCIEFQKTNKTRREEKPL